MDSNVHLLLVEDEALIALSVRGGLEDGGYAVHHVASGEEALAAIRISEAPFSGLITDIRLGDGPDGWDVARFAREVSPSLPVIYVSGDSGHEHSSRGVPDSVMLPKPFAIAQLVTAVSTLLNAVPPDPAASLTPP